MTSPTHTGPYIITTRREGRLPGKQYDKAYSSVAAATPEEAQRKCDVAADSADPTGASAQSLDEHGDTITLSDGSIIEVKPTTWMALAKALGAHWLEAARSAQLGDAKSQQSIIAAYDAAQEG